MRPRIEHRSAFGAHTEAVLNTEPKYEEGDLTAARVSGEVHPDPDMVKYIFELQGRVEKGERTTDGEGAEKGMDYHEYARLFWAEKAPEEMRENQQVFAVFEKLLVYELQHISMEKLVYPEVGDSIVELIKQYGDAIKSVGIWSTGDVDATGYQVSKIMRSQVIGGFRRGLKTAVTDMPERRQFLKEKTHYIVDNDKFERLAQFVASRIDSVPAGEKMKIVIIEDSKGNFGKAEKALNEAGFEGRFEIVPIWATYSREGQAAAKKDGFEEDKARLNGIDSFADLTNQDRFKGLLQDGYLFVDFDGVIGDNIRMREKQAEATYRAFLSGVQVGERAE
jgi:hypothetical protein